MNKLDLDKYNLIEKEIIPTENIINDYEDIKNKILNNKNLFLDMGCFICHSKELNIISIYKEKDNIILINYCEQCKDYSKLVFNIDNGISKKEYYFEDIDDKKIKSEMNIIKKDYMFFKEVDPTIFYILGIISCLSMFIGVIPFFIIFGGYLILTGLFYLLKYLLSNYYSKLEKKIDNKIRMYINYKYFPKYNKSATMNGYVLSYKFFYKYNESETINEYYRTFGYLLNQRQYYNLLRESKIYSIIISNEMSKISYNEKLMKKNLKNKEDERAKQIYYKIYNLEKEVSSYQIELDLVTEQIKYFKSCMIEEKNKAIKNIQDTKKTYDIQYLNNLDTINADIQFEKYKKEYI